MSEYVEFVVPPGEGLGPLQRAVAALRREKDAERRRPPEELEALFDAAVLARFSRPGADERARRRHELETHVVIETPTEEAAGQRWDFDSMIHGIMEGDYELLGCEPSDAGRARLRFQARGYPYGGVGALVALVEAFGFTISGIEDGTGYVAVASRPA